METGGNFEKTNATFNSYFLALYSYTIISFKSVTMRFQDYLVLSENCSYNLGQVLVPTATETTRTTVMKNSNSGEATNSIFVMKL